MPCLCAVTAETVLEVAAEFRTVVGLDQSECEAELRAGSPDDLGGNAWSYTVVHLGICHTGVQVNDGVHVAPTFSEWTDVVDGICLDQLSRCGDHWTSGIVWSDPFPAPIDGLVAPQNAAHTTEADMDILVMRQVVPDDFGAALQCPSQCKYAVDHSVSNGMRE
jgi:hypothetical protein